MKGFYHCGIGNGKGSSSSWVRQLSDNKQTSGPQSLTLNKLKAAFGGGLRSLSASILVYNLNTY